MAALILEHLRHGRNALGTYKVRVAKISLLQDDVVALDGFEALQATAPLGRHTMRLNRQQAFSASHIGRLKRRIVLRSYVGGERGRFTSHHVLDHTVTKRKLDLFQYFTRLTVLNVGALVGRVQMRRQLRAKLLNLLHAEVRELLNADAVDLLFRNIVQHADSVAGVEGSLTPLSRSLQLILILVN